MSEIDFKTFGFPPNVTLIRQIEEAIDEIYSIRHLLEEAAPEDYALYSVGIAMVLDMSDAERSILFSQPVDLLHFRNLMEKWHEQVNDESSLLRVAAFKTLEGYIWLRRHRRWPFKMDQSFFKASIIARHLQIVVHSKQLVVS